MKISLQTDSVNVEFRRIFVRRLTGLILITTLAFPLLVLAETKNMNKKATSMTSKDEIVETPKSETDKYSTAQIDINKEKLPPGFYGNDPKIICSVLKARKSTAKKDEFETTDQFQKRVEAEKKLPVVGNISLDNLFALQVQDLKDNIKYSADDSEFTIKIQLGKVYASTATTLAKIRNQADYSEDYNKNAKATRLFKELVQTRTYTASNSYGATIEVEEKNYEEYKGAIANYYDFPYYEELNELGRRLKDMSPSLFNNNDDSYKDLTISSKLRATPTEAKSIKDNLKVLLIGKLVNPLISDSFSHIKPTRKVPHEITALTNYIYLNLTEIWIYDQATGQIFTKIRKK